MEVAVQTDEIYFSFESPEAKELLCNCEYLFSQFLSYGKLMHRKMLGQNITVTEAAPDVLLMNYREMMEITDGIGVLLSKGCVVASTPLLRTQLELFVQIERMICDQTDTSARAYLYCHYKERQEAERKKWIKAEMTDEEFQKINEEYEAGCSLPEYKEINDKWMHFTKKTKKPPRLKWFNLTNEPFTGGIYKLVSEAAPEMGVIYNHLSSVVHGNGGLSHSVEIESGIGLNTLRSPFMIAPFMRFSLSIQCNVYKLFAKKFLKSQDVDEVEKLFEQHLKKLNESIELERKIV